MTSLREMITMELDYISTFDQPLVTGDVIQSQLSSSGDKERLVKKVFDLIPKHARQDNEDVVEIPPGSSSDSSESDDSSDEESSDGKGAETPSDTELTNN